MACTKRTQFDEANIFRSSLIQATKFHAPIFLPRSQKQIVLILCNELYYSLCSIITFYLFHIFLSRLRDFISISIGRNSLIRKEKKKQYTYLPLRLKNAINFTIFTIACHFRLLIDTIINFF